MVASSSSEAVANAREYDYCDPGMCLKYVRTWLEIPSHYGDADDAWYGSKVKHPGDRNPPAGAPCFYLGGNHGHIALSVGGGKVRSTDCEDSGHVSEVSISWCEQAWGRDYAGWSEDLNGVSIPWLVGAEGGESEDDMPLSEDDIQKIADAVWAKEFKDYVDKDADGTRPLITTSEALYSARQDAWKAAQK